MNPGSKFESQKNPNYNQKDKMSDTTTYMTDFMVMCLNDEYDHRESDGEIPQFFERFCYDGQLYDDKPTWKYEEIKSWIKESLEIMGGFDNLPVAMQHAIYRDIDQDHLADWLTDKHTNWRDEEEEEEEEEEEDVKDPLEPVPDLPPRDCRVNDPC